MPTARATFSQSCPPGSRTGRARNSKLLRRNLLLLLLSLTLPGAHPAGAADWLVIASGAGDVLMVDRDAFRRSGEIAEARTLHSHEGEIAAATQTPAYRSELARLRFDCSAGTFAVTERVFFSGELGSGRKVGKKTEPEPPVSATTQREKMLVDMACGR